jgi:hypothetical protein
LVDGNATARDGDNAVTGHDGARPDVALAVAGRELLSSIDVGGELSVVLWMHESVRS